MDNKLISVIIPTLNRFKYLLNAIESVKSQSYKNIEIIVVNDCSDQKEYYTYDYKDVKIIHLEKNSKQIYGYNNAGYVRNIGINNSKGEYIAFLDDDDMWISPYKIEKQLYNMNLYGCNLSCTEGYIGNGIYDKNNKYKLYMQENFIDIVKNIYKNKNSNLLDNGYPKIWTKEFLKVHNSCINSSIMFKKSLYYKCGGFRDLSYAEDYDLIMRILDHTNCVFINIPSIYYDDNHGYGSHFNT